MFRFGYSAGVPSGVVTAWGARAIVSQTGSVDLVGDRQDAVGDDAEVDWLLAQLNGGVNSAWMARVRDLLRGYEMRTGKAEHFVLFTDDRVTVVGNTKGSGGYLYVAAFRTPAGGGPAW